MTILHLIVHRFHDILQEDQSFDYDYNPCSTFTTVDPCTDVYVSGQTYSQATKGICLIFDMQICQSTTDGTGHYKIANTGTEQIYIDKKEGIYVYYTSPGDGTDVR